jgi:hypothetical protein
MSELTHVELVWVKQRIEYWIRFGRTAEEHVLDRQWRLVSATGAVLVVPSRSSHKSWPLPRRPAACIAGLDGALEAPASAAAERRALRPRAG